MEAVLSKEIQAGLDAARLAALRRSSRLRIERDGKVFPVLRKWKTGFAIAAEDAPRLRGLVDLYDGGVHLFQCLVVAEAEAEGQMLYEFKRATPVADRAALDFVRRPDAPVALITDDSGSF